MKKLSVKSTQIFVSIYKLLSDKELLKINNAEDTFMPLFVEKLGKVKVREAIFERISFAHYYEQDGELIPDPEMFFLFEENSETVIPYYFLTGNILEEKSIIFDKNGDAKEIYENIQASQIEFADLWLRNISEQQNL